MRAGDRFAEWMSCRIGSPLSIFLHTAAFVACFEAWLLGEVRLEDMLLWLTTIVSLEAIYIGLFLQNSANRHGGINEHQAAEDFRSDAVLACRQSALRRVLIESLAHRDFLRAKKAAIACMRLLAEHGIGGGESGVAGLAGCLLVSSDPEARETIGLTTSCRVLTFNTEGVTDPLLYEQMVGHRPHSLQRTDGSRRD